MASVVFRPRLARMDSYFRGAAVFSPAGECDAISSTVAMEHRRVVINARRCWIAGMMVGWHGRVAVAAPRATVKQVQVRLVPL